MQDAAIMAAIKKAVKTELETMETNLQNDINTKASKSDFQNLQDEVNTKVSQADLEALKVSFTVSF